jgi:DNA polymerase III subunit epsilon
LNTIQLAFNFDSDTSEAHAPSAPPKRMAKKMPKDVHNMALELEKHPDYRVLRRLQPTMQFGPAAAGARLQTVVLLDTETTGLEPAKNAIIELALVRVQVDMAWGVPVGAVQVYDGLQDPGRPIPPEVVELTGIQDADVAGKQLDEVRIAELLQGADWVIAHNAGFDRPFCEARLPQYRHLQWACSVSDMNWKAEGRSSAKLEQLALAQGWFYDAHRAEMDCHALLAVLAQPLPKKPGTGLMHLLTQAARPSYRLYATSAPFDAKDTLKARGYRWNAEARVWFCALVGDEALQAECEWLQEQVYQRRGVTVQLEKLHAGLRYSSRPGEMLQVTL